MLDPNSEFISGNKVDDKFNKMVYDIVSNIKIGYSKPEEVIVG